MAVRAQGKFPAGPIQVTYRTVLVVLAVTPLALAALALPDVGLNPLLIAGLVLALGYIFSLPEREGLWIGTYLLYRLLDRWLPRVVRENRGRATSIRRVGGHLQIRARHRAPARLPSRLSRWSELPRVAQVESGLLKRSPGSWCTILELEGPDDAPQTDEYTEWCRHVQHWLGLVGCPAQVYADVTHFDPATAEKAFQAKVRGYHNELVESERALAGEEANNSLVIRHYVVLFPRLAGGDGIPVTARLRRLLEAPDAQHDETEQLRDAALRQAVASGLRVTAADPHQIQALMRRTPLGCAEGTFVDGEAILGGVFHRYALLTGLPRTLSSGAVVSALLRARVAGAGISLFIFPVEYQVARRELRDQKAVFQAMWKHSQDAEAEVLYRQAAELDDMLLTKQTTALRMTLALHAEGGSAEAAEHALERLEAGLTREGLEMERVTMPSFTVALAASPAGNPLSRGLLLTTAEVVASLLPARGTPFGDLSRPLLGRNAATHASVYVSVFDQPNYSALILGSAGSGKSATCKTWLIREALQGARVLVIDPESEYQRVISALDGTYVELGEHSLNAFAVDPSVHADEAAEWVVPILSIMGGEEQGYVNNRPVRHLSGADKAWLHHEVTQFFADWRREQAAEHREPILADFIDYLLSVSMARIRSLHVDVEARLKRCADISERLRAYTQGRKGRIFNRPSSFHFEGRAMGVGLYALANQFRADLTPALAFVLSAVLADLARMRGKRIIMVDEAHKILVDPDAGDVLAQVVRTARKRGAGVWMASQSVRDFVSPSDNGGAPTPGEVLASVAATKLILGVEDAVAAAVQRTFSLSDRELRAITNDRTNQPGQARRGVLIAGNERAVVEVVPGNHLMPLINTTHLEDALHTDSETGPDGTASHAQATLSRSIVGARAGSVERQ